MDDILNKQHKRRVVVTGMVCVSPIGCSPQELFNNLLKGNNNFTLHRGVMISLVSDSFDRKCYEWGLQKYTKLESYALSAIKDAIAYSGIDLVKENTLGLCVGTSQNLSDSKAKSGDVLSTIIHEIGFGGECIALPVACSGGNAAIAVAMSKIQSGNTDIFLAGGVEAYTDLCFSTFNVLQILSNTGCRPFTAHRDGITIGEGAGFLVL